MTRLSLSQTCLLDVSGELGRKAKAQLQEHVARYPAAMLEYELTRSQFDLLRSVPKLPLDQVAAQCVADAIKAGIHETLHQQKRDEIARRRWRLAYKALAGISGIAAVLVIGFTVQMAQREADARNVARAESHVRDYLSTDSTNQTDDELNHVANQLAALEDDQVSLATPDHGIPASVQDLINSVDDVPDMPDDPGSI